MPQSTGASGGKKRKKGRAPAHQNKYAFRHNPKSKKTDKILASPNVGVCRRCHEKIEWRKQYRKYKPLTQPGKCNLCQRRNIKAAYHTICADCAVGDRANKAVLEATTSTSAAASGKTEAEPEVATEGVSNADQQVADAVDSASDHGSDDEEETPETPRNRWVCEICVKDYALGSLEDDEEGDELAQLEAALEGKLKLREKRAIERKIERLVEERRRNRRKAKQQEQEEEDNDESGEEDGSNAAENEKNDDDVEEKVGIQKDTKADANDDDSGDEVEEEDDPFLKAIGGADKLLTGEAYQKALLEKAGEV